MPGQNEDSQEEPQAAGQQPDTSSQTLGCSPAEDDQASGNFPWQDHEYLG
jgi:hypothetical protein